MGNDFSGKGSLDGDSSVIDEPGRITRASVAKGNNARGRDFTSKDFSETDSSFRVRPGSATPESVTPKSAGPKSATKESDNTASDSAGGDDQFELADFLPYLLNRAAEESSLGFQRHYRERYGMLRTEWRVLFHIGRYGELTAREICDRGRMHKTKVSRAVGALEKKRYLERRNCPDDRRREPLGLTRLGMRVYEALLLKAQGYDAELVTRLSAGDVEVLKRCLKRLIES